MPLTSPLGPTLETERLILRPPVAEDFAAFCAFEVDAETVKFLAGVKAPPVVWRSMRAMEGGGTWTAFTCSA
jgi:RimJ/RimL family protein N-acetyltransferase